MDSNSRNENWTLQFFSPENKTKVTKCASENGVTASLHHFKQTSEFNTLKENTVHGWVKQYWSELQPAAGELSTGTVCAKKLCNMKQERPLLIGKDLEHQVQELIREIQSCTGVVNIAMTSAAVKGIVLEKDVNMLSQNGG